MVTIAAAVAIIALLAVPYIPAPKRWAEIQDQFAREDNRD